MGIATFESCEDNETSQRLISLSAADSSKARGEIDVEGPQAYFDLTKKNMLVVNFDDHHNESKPK